jgi:SAM-dependent methyltransferase
VIEYHELTSSSQQTALSWLQTNVEPGNTILEVGCGRGGFLRALREAGYNAIGVDLVPEVVERVRDDGFQAWCGRIDEIPADWPRRQPAVVVSFFRLHQLSDGEFLEYLGDHWPVPLVLGHTSARAQHQIERAVTHAGYAVALCQATAANGVFIVASPNGTNSRRPT